MPNGSIPTLQDSKERGSGLANFTSPEQLQNSFTYYFNVDESRKWQVGGGSTNYTGTIWEA
jgi:hypothetical protein